MPRSTTTSPLKFPSITATNTDTTNATNAATTKTVHEHLTDLITQYVCPHMPPSVKFVHVVDFGCASAAADIQPLCSLAHSISKSSVGVLFRFSFNDFPSEVLDGVPKFLREMEEWRKIRNAIVSVVPGSFFQELFQPESVTIALSASAVHSLSALPAPLTGSIYCEYAHHTQKRAWIDAASTDWHTFLSLRHRELEVGGRLVVAVPGQDQHGEHCLCSVIRSLDRIFETAVSKGVITQNEYDGFFLDTRYRTQAEILAPFLHPRWDVEGLIVEHFSLEYTQCSLYAKYCRDENLEAYVSSILEVLQASLSECMCFSLSHTRTSVSDVERVLDSLWFVIAEQIRKRPQDFALDLVTFFLVLRKDKNACKPPSSRSSSLVTPSPPALPIGCTCEQNP